MKWFDTDNRSSKILKILDKEKKVSGEYLAQKLEVGEKTIRNDINEINRRLGNTGLIDCKHGYYKLYVTNTSGYMTRKNQIAKENAYFESPQMRMAFIVDTLMNSDTPYLMDELAYAMNIGRTTLVGDIKKLKEILDFYDLKIQGKPNTGLTLEGDELNLRFFVFENIYHILYSENSIEEELIQIIKEETRNYQMDSIAVTYFQQFLSIALDRISENKNPGGEFELDESVFDKVINVNVKGVFLCSQLAGKEMVKQGSGVIVNMSSECGLEGSEGQSVYAATKNAVNSLTRSWAKEMGKQGVRVVGVAPGIMEATGLRTPSYENALSYTRGMTIEELRAGYGKTSTTPLGRSGKLEEVADLVCYLASDRASYIHGVTYNVAGGKTRG